MKKHRTQRGAAVVEFALLCGLLLMFLVGIFEFGLIWIQSNYIANAAREGARIAAKPDSVNRELEARKAASEYLANLVLYERFVSRDNKGNIVRNNGVTVFSPSDLVTVNYSTEDLIDAGTTISHLAKVTVNVKTQHLWKPILWPLIMNILPGQEYDPGLFNVVTHTAAYDIIQ